MTDREKLIALLTEYFGVDPMFFSSVGVRLVNLLLDNGVVVREKGEWRRVYEEGEGWVDICSRCKAIGDETDFCHNCGADMRKEKPEA